MRKSRHTRIRLIFIFATAFLLSLSVYCYFRINELTQSYYYVNHSNAVKLELEKFASTIKDVEASSRGFLLTRDSIFLDEFQHHVRKIDAKIILLRDMTKDNPLQQRYLDTLQKITQRRVLAISDVVRKGSIDLVPIPQRMKNRAMRVYFRKHINKMIAVEDSGLKRRTALLYRQSALTPPLTILLMISALIALILSYLAISRELRISDQLKDSLQARKGELTQNNLILQARNEELAAANKELEAFTYISSHDLQEPLRKIQTLISLVGEKEAENLSMSGQNYLERIRNSAHRMQALIQDLLAYSRVSNRNFAFEQAHFGTLVAEVIAELEEEILEKQAIIDVQGESQLRIIPAQFRQLLLNLISNAVKFSREGVTPAITLSNTLVGGAAVPFAQAKTEALYHLVEVADNGIGFDPQYRDRIFEVFQRLYSDQQYAGTGIGLAIVRKVVENHNGFIAANSQEGQGAVFSIYIPA